jgi:hypothetical protein
MTYEERTRHFQRAARGYYSHYTPAERLALPRQAELRNKASLGQLGREEIPPFEQLVREAEQYITKMGGYPGAL